MDTQALRTASSRMALAALLHDLGKFAERARIEEISDIPQDKLDTHVQLYARRQENQGKVWYSHRHAAYTALAMDIIQPHLPPLVGEDFTPFGSWKGDKVDDSLVNAAALHHKPETFLQWIIATADRTASGFERNTWEQYNNARDEQPESPTGRNHYTARLLTLFEQAGSDGQYPEVSRTAMQWRYPLKSFSVSAAFPDRRESCEGNDNDKAQAEYRALWQQFMQDLQRIPASHRQDLPLWLDHFDSLWLTCTHAIPSATAFGTRPDVSLYDHSRTTAALAVALWRYHHDRHLNPEDFIQAQRNGRTDWDEPKFLLIQGDFYGIQKFIFAEGGETSRRAAKLLRGRSFQVSLLMECAAQRILDALALPPQSQVINAAGKFLIVAPNTPEVQRTLGELRQSFNAWFLQHTYGESGIGMAWTTACCNDFVAGDTHPSAFTRLMARLYKALDDAKYRHLQLAGDTPAAKPVFRSYLDTFNNELGPCVLTGRLPATRQLNDYGNTLNCSDLALTQILIGERLVKPELTRVLITREPLGGREGNLTASLPLDHLGLYVTFVPAEDASGKYGPLVREGKMLRAWDFSLPGNDPDTPLFNGYARRNINGYVPVFRKADFSHREELLAGLEDLQEGQIMPLDLISRANIIPAEENGSSLQGVDALITLKGDIDDLGNLFMAGLQGDMTFARMASLSRQIDAFFSVFLPWLCSPAGSAGQAFLRKLGLPVRHFSNTYTVFAGGDDFFMIGPWKDQIELAHALNTAFRRYVAGNPHIHFSCGMVQTKPGAPIRHFAEAAEDALECSKAWRDNEGRAKNAVTLYGITRNWDEFDALLKARDALEDLRADYAGTGLISTGYLYSLIRLSEDAEAAERNPAAAMWASRFAYRTFRQVQNTFKGDKERREAHDRLATELGDRGLRRWKAAFAIPLFLHFYSLRKPDLPQHTDTPKKETQA